MLVARLKKLPLLQRIAKSSKKIIDALGLAVTFFSGKEKGGSVQQKIKRKTLQKVALAGAALVIAVVMVVAMTAAWYSNVIQTTGLIFKVSDWGLDSSVEIGEKFLQAAPGDSGVLELEVFNSSDSLIDVNLSIGKTGMYNDLADMRKRLYFYIDDTVTRAEERTSRVYVNSQESYSYTVLAKQTLFLGDYGNGAPLKWEWVYDVLGYYFYGIVNDTSAAQITEYLRPVEYDFDSAVFENDKLAKVGNQTAKDFIVNVSKNDGYAGTVTQTVTDATGRVYYPVAVDDNGMGVWVYCCSLSEIEQENAVDTALGNAGEAALRQFSTNLNVVAQQKKLTVANVASADQLRTALTDESYNTVVLQQDIALTEALTLPADSEKVVDLGGYTLSTDLSGTVISATEGSALTLLNGTLQGSDGHSGSLIHAVGSDIAISGVTIADVDRVLNIEDHKGSGGDTRVNIIGSTFQCTGIGVFIKGNGTASPADTYLNIENSQIICTGTYALVGSGNGPQGGTTIRVAGSTLQAEYTAIYHPQANGDMHIDTSILLGLTPLVVKGGNVTVNSTEITATSGDQAAAMIAEPKLEASGFADTGAAVYVETGYDNLTKVILSGDNTVTAYYQQAVLLFEENNPNYTVEITGGSYSHDVSAFVADGYICQSADGRYLVAKAE